MNNRSLLFLSWLFAALLPGAPAAAEGPDAAELEVPERIEVFRIYPCRDCDELEAFFTREGIPYQNYDLKNNEQALADYLQNIGRGLLPVTRVNNRHVRGFKPLQVLRLIQGEEIEPPDPSELMSAQAGAEQQPQVQKSPEELARGNVARLKSRLDAIMAHYDAAAERYKGGNGGEDGMLYSEIARFEIANRVLELFRENEKMLSELERGADKKHYDSMVKKYVTLARRTVRKRHGRMIAINERLLNKWREPLEQELSSWWDRLYQSYLAEAQARAAEQGEKGKEQKPPQAAARSGDKPMPAAPEKRERLKPGEIIIVR